MQRPNSHLALVVLLAMLMAVRGASQDEPASHSPATFTAEQIAFFENDIRPLLVEHCQDCHGAEKQEGHLRLDSREAILAGGDTGPAVVPGNIAEGELLRALSYDPAGYQMPPEGQLPAESIALLTRWVELGAPWPDEASTLVAREEFDLPTRAAHWAYHDLSDVEPADVTQPQWCRSPLDQYLLASLEAADLSPTGEVARDLWLRRAYFDVIGLPPTPSEVREFLADGSPDAYERVIDRLLASPRYGERWARHWLDLTRYTETRGHQYDYNIPNTWHYRDYVVRAFNADVPYDQFVIEHVAGDLLQPVRQQQPLALEESAAPSTSTPRLPVETWYVAADDAAASATEPVDETAFTAEQLDFFETDVRPLLVENCQSCHGADKQEGNLRLDSRPALLTGGDTGPAIVPGHPEQSELILAISYDPSGYQMPPDGKLLDDAIETLNRWIEMGAPWPDEQTEAAAREEFELAERAERYGFQPLAEVVPPQVNQPAWCQSPIDQFLLSRLEAAGLTPAAAADRRVWIRRAYLDVIGLPPSVAEVEAFVADTAPTAYETVIDRLLSSPQYGERWGRHWLDLARYADSRGHEFDYDVPNGWRYRDYVIRAFNDDLPYDQFVVEQVAGDLLRSSADTLADAPPLDVPTSSFVSGTNDPAQIHDGTVATIPLQDEYFARYRENGANESILGTAFWFFGEGVHSPVDIRQDEADRFADMIDVFSKTFLGMTVACARCHDHKFDPIRAADFYALQGYLQSTSYRQAMFETMDHNLQVARQLDELHDRARPELLSIFAELSQPVVEQLPAYLTVAREWITAAGIDGSESFTAEQFSDEQRQQLAQLAMQRGLDGELQIRWTAHLLRARHVLNDPLHIAAQPDPVDALRSQFQLMQVETQRALEHQAHNESGANAPASEVIYSANPSVLPASEGPTSQGALTQDGVSFGTGELQPGDLILNDDAGAPIERVVTEAVMRRDPIWNGLSYAPGTIDDPGRLDGWERGGRTLRTRTFDITNGKIFIYLRGGCRTYVEVDSHTINNGPLHGSLMREHPLPENDPSGRQWRWVEHDVSRYQGHRAHLQIVLRGTEPLEIAAVVQCDRVPPFEPIATASPWWSVFQFIDDESTDEHVVELAAAAFADALATLQGQELHRIISEETPLRLAEWMRQHPELFGLDTESARAFFADVATPFLEERRKLIASIRTESATAPCMMEISPEDEYIFIRGNWRKAGDVVPRRFLEVFGGHGPVSGEGLVSTESHSGSGRLDLALQLVDPEQTPILPRVIVNRIWLHYFGRGIVSTPDDFGHLGELPSHPELLDWLARELVEHDWSLKHMHRLILLSSAYRMSSDAVDAAAEEADPNNVLLHRMNVKRMEGEIIRDAMLAISGSLNETMYGPPVPVFLTPFMEGRGRPGSSGPLDGNGRRSIYISVRRNFLDPMFQAFDFPLPHTTVGRRIVSNVPAQALTLMNSPLVHELSDRWARRMLAETAESDTDNRIVWLYATAFSRQPTDTELTIGRDFVTERSAETGASTENADLWSEYCHVLLNTKEFIFVR